jgi:hypothetical protein
VAIEDPLIFKGTTITIRAVAKENGEAPAKEFFEKELKESDRAKVTAIFRLLDINKGNLSNREKYKDLLDYDGVNFKEIKQHQTRLGCFWRPGYNLYLTNGFKKKKDDWPKGEVQKLQNMYDEFKKRQTTKG